MRDSLVLFLIAASVAFAQGHGPAFDAASVKANTSDDHIVDIHVGPGGHFMARGYSLKLLVQQAYQVKGFQVSGGPGWLDTDRWDITASGAADATNAQINSMLQALLAERFALRVHRVSKEMPGFELSVAGGRSKLKPSLTTEENPGSSRRKGAALVADGITTATFAKMLGAYLSKPVSDKTGLSGLYDVRVEWTERADQLGDADAQGVSLVDALRDQLGLRLAARRVTAETIAIDGAAKASAN